MYGSVRGAISDGRPYRDTYVSTLQFLVTVGDVLRRIGCVSDLPNAISMDHGVLAEVTNPNNLNDGPCNALLIHDGRLGLNRPLRVVL